MQEKVVNPKDFVVVTFRNNTDFGFTPEMGCMYDGRAINGVQGGPGVNAGESMTLPYHVGRQLAVNLAKIVKIRKAPLQDTSATGLAAVAKPLWNDEDLENTTQSFLTEMYSEQRATPKSETDLLMEKVEEYKRMVDQLLPKTPAPVIEAPVEIKQEVIADAVPPAVPPTIVPQAIVFVDKQEVMAELTKRGIKFDARQNKANLEKLLV